MKIYKGLGYLTSIILLVCKDYIHVILLFGNYYDVSYSYTLFI